MDQLSEHIQQNLSKNFEYEDDEVIDRLRDVMYELRSNRLASPGPAPGMVNYATIFIRFTRRHGARINFKDNLRLVGMH